MVSISAISMLEDNVCEAFHGAVCCFMHFRQVENCP
jgi:hypothetical protein